MRSIDYARSKGRAARQTLGSAPADLLSRLQSHLENTHGVHLVPMHPAQMTGGRAEINAETTVLKYDASLAGEELVTLFAHELGHLVLHQRLRDGDSHPDPLTASAYGMAGPSAIARYSPRTYEETQAAAFALELVAPSDDVWTMWSGDDGSTTMSLAAHFGCSVAVIHTQLAHALHAIALGGALPSASRKEVPFTPAQLAAARFTGAPAIVDAGPGTGKTATVVERIRYLLEEQGASPSDILSLTFSNEAAQELSERAAIAFGDDIADQLNVRTFHGFGVEFLHLHGHTLGLSERFELLDEDRQIELVNELLGIVPCGRIVDLHAPRETAASVVGHINYCKQRLHGVAALGALHALDAPDAVESALEFADLFRAYESHLRRSNQVDLADLIALPIRVLERHDDVRAQYAARFPWVIVDEFQDVTRATSRLLGALCGEHNPPWVVGDARQAIYQFLGAAPENVTAFVEDFENAHVFTLDVNHRSSAPVVTAANQLAGLLEEQGAATGAADGINTMNAQRERWTPGTTIAPVGRVPVVVAEAATDAAEAAGVVAQVREWIADDGVSPGDIAVLCRRHVDVRRVILELTRRGIKAQASGVLTAEGAAGDLAVMLTLADAPAASVPRGAFALGRGRRSAAQLNAAIAELLQELRGESLRRGAPERRDIASEVRRLHETLKHERHGADGFSTLATVLFDHGTYLRRILATPDTAERQMALVEIVSVLSLATAYRSTHRGMPARIARIGFAEGLRARLTRTLPVPLSPRPRLGAVHVMTCHASKGLEFPCVAVVGQTLPAIERTLQWLPPALRPEQSREEAQANALLFVAVTRAKRAVLVSWARRDSAGTRGKGRAVVPLLEWWRAAFDVPTVQWAVDAVSSSRMHSGSVSNIWSVPLRGEVKAGALADSVCPIKSYLETCVQARFPSASRELYPSWVSGVRRSLTAVLRWAQETRSAASDDEARAIVDAEWPAADHADHQHAGLYRDAAKQMVAAFARAFRPMALQGVASLDAEVVLPSTDGLNVRLDLIAHYRQADGTAVVIAFRPESLARSRGARVDGSGTGAQLNWSGLAESKRGSLALFEHVRPGATPYVYSGRDGRIYEYRWSRKRKSLPMLVAGLEARRAAFARGEFGAEVSRYQCDRCRVRASCPQWIGALETANDVCT